VKVGLLLYELIEHSSLESLSDEPAEVYCQLGPMLLTSSEDAKLVCALLIRLITSKSNTTFKDFWPMDEPHKYDTDFHTERSLAWVEKFHGFLDRLDFQGLVYERFVQNMSVMC